MEWYEWIILVPIMAILLALIIALISFFVMIGWNFVFGNYVPINFVQAIVLYFLMSLLTYKGGK
jgi:ABC-type polysaccharide/polyol phosphate export permease